MRSGEVINMMEQELHDERQQTFLEGSCGSFAICIIPNIQEFVANQIMNCRCLKRDNMMKLIMKKSLGA